MQFQKECEDLRNEVKMVIEENKKLSGMAPHEAPVKEVQVLNESNPYHEKKMHEHSINNLKAQIRILLEVSLVFCLKDTKGQLMVITSRKRRLWRTYGKLPNEPSPIMS